jgi:hypothetical protein
MTHTFVGLDLFHRAERVAAIRGEYAWASDGS